MRCKDGKESWRRKGIRIVERQLEKIHESEIFKTKKDFIKFLPQTLPSPFTNRILSHHLNCSVKEATRLTYCLKKMGVITEFGKMGRSIAYKIAK